MSTPSIIRATWILIIIGLIARSILFFAFEEFDIGLALYLLGPYLALALVVHWLQKERKPAIVLFVGAILAVLVTVVALLAAVSGVFQGWGAIGAIILIPAAQLVVVVICIIIAVLLKLFTES